MAISATMSPPAMARSPLDSFLPAMFMSVTPSAGSDAGRWWGWRAAVAARRCRGRDQRWVTGPAADHHEVPADDEPDEGEDEAAGAEAADEIEQAADQSEREPVDDQVLALAVEPVHLKATDQVEQRADSGKDDADQRKEEDAGRAAVGGDTKAVEVAARGADRGQREGCDQPKEAQKDDADDAQDAGDQPDRLGGDVDLDGWVCGERRIGEHIGHGFWCFLPSL